MTQSITIIRTIYPEPDTELSNCDWLVQWTTSDGTHCRWFEDFEAVSRFVEGEL